MLNQMSFQRRIALLLGTAIAGVVLLIVINTVQAYNDIMAGRREVLQTALQAISNHVLDLQQQASAGKIPEDVAQATAREAIRAARFGGADGKTEYFYAWTLDGVSVMHPMKLEWAGKNMMDKIVDGNGRRTLQDMVDGLRASGNGRAFVDTRFPRPGGKDAVPKLQYVVQIPGWNWMVGSGLYLDDVKALVWRAALEQIGIGAVVLVITVAMGLAIARSVLGQLGGEPRVAIAAMQDVARGDLSPRLSSARGDSLMGQMQAMVEALRTTIGQVRAAIDSISTAAGEIAQGNQDLSARTEQAASNLQQTASSMEEMSGAVGQSADTARQANQLAVSAAEAAQRGGSVVARVTESMAGITDSSRRIGDIIGVIDGIAFQTNILALNAAVEAARAGEQGRGFAVVAGEVRSLAQRSAEAAKEIKSLIGASVSNVEQGAGLVEQTGKAMQDIVGSVSRVSDLIGEIAAAASEQRDGIQQVNQAVTQLDQMTQQNAALVEESAAAAQSMREQAQRLAEAVSAFRLG
ncbi:methyl-accepting chemotaxis protein [Roseateles saccharophilus]|uniref:Methyl-accepting chemotaxis sensory transducer with Cache sensor n=1 Tax=Roseateles saccharophilus TaxID=304 RepID=A0A4R3VC31_ROSSA|nr:methyl-accepting chemotaxis protein [Roseateles saccharophilus]MDG0831804.1 chemotaxis protein [Roseateles saccharophilus]TCV01174.1 methyl-accepting chemotaxis sensory transducer with Cache sensor [Roseateles saccharophilus]